MLTRLLLLLLPCLSVLPISPATQQPSKLELPPQARDALYLKFPDWRYADVPDEIREVLKRDYGPTSRPDLISGDFDGNGQADYAALIYHGTIRVEKGELVYPSLCLVVFLAQDYGYQLHAIEDPGGEYIQLIRKGDGGYDYETQKEFIYQHDAIDAIIFEKAATSYVYENGRFRAIITGD
jgi:hypothetical protein